ncbi:hypothetical protein POM88_031505 [Heracleum sosnowskyi]|uniref:Transposase MuDR plant domain-containing protein n=1 Tax=Heracleum sosnowskyi TaxID=360622 RepID=A0AAD8HZJ5_9APIA|nr:hypothetical protein POM88_031505 [Heracleum sosnowskyi]
MVRLHLYQEKLEDRGDPEPDDEVNAWKETERMVLGHNVEFGQDLGNNERAEYQSESGDDEDYEGESDDGDDEDENQDDGPEHDIGDGIDSDLSDFRRIREEVRREQEALNIEMSQEIREALKKYRSRESDDDDTYDGLYSSDDDDTDDGIAYAEPKAKKKKVRVNEVFKICTAAKDIKWVPCLIFGDKNQVKAAVRSYSIDTGRPLRYSVNDLQRIQVVCAKGCPFKTWLSYLKEKEYLDLEDGFGFTLILDKQKGLDKAVRELLPLVEHRFCARHLSSNLTKKHPSEAMPTPNVQQSHAQNGSPPASKPPSHGTCRRGRPKKSTQLTAGSFKFFMLMYFDSGN